MFWKLNGLSDQNGLGVGSDEKGGRILLVRKPIHLVQIDILTYLL